MRRWTSPSQNDARDEQMNLTPSATELSGPAAFLETSSIDQLIQFSGSSSPPCDLSDSQLIQSHGMMNELCLFRML